MWCRVQSESRWTLLYRYRTLTIVKCKYTTRSLYVLDFSLYKSQTLPLSIEGKHVFLSKRFTVYLRLIIQKNLTVWQLRKFKWINWIFKKVHHQQDLWLLLPKLESSIYVKINCCRLVNNCLLSINLHDLFLFSFPIELQIVNKEDNKWQEMKQRISIADMLGIYRKMSTVLKCERLRGDIY